MSFNPKDNGRSKTEVGYLNSSISDKAIQAKNDTSWKVLKDCTILRIRGPMTFDSKDCFKAEADGMLCDILLPEGVWVRDSTGKLVQGIKNVKIRQTLSELQLNVGCLESDYYLTNCDLQYRFLSHDEIRWHGEVVIKEKTKKASIVRGEMEQPISLIADKIVPTPSLLMGSPEDGNTAAMKIKELFKAAKFR